MRIIPDSDGEPIGTFQEAWSDAARAAAAASRSKRRHGGNKANVRITGRLAFRNAGGIERPHRIAARRNKSTGSFTTPAMAAQARYHSKQPSTRGRSHRSFLRSYIRSK